MCIRDRRATGRCAQLESGASIKGGAGCMYVHATRGGWGSGQGVWRDGRFRACVLVCRVEGAIRPTRAVAICVAPWLLQFASLSASVVSWVHAWVGRARLGSSGGGADGLRPREMRCPAPTARYSSYELRGGQRSGLTFGW
eukprot:1393864-Prymnesium_polylepis.2